MLKDEVKRPAGKIFDFRQINNVEEICRIYKKNNLCYKCPYKKKEDTI